MSTNVTFYSSFINRKNRYYDAQAYESGLANKVLGHAVLNKDIVPDTPFYINSTNDFWYKADYITYELNGVKYGAFITHVQPLAISTTIRVEHSTDWWYYFLFNSYNKMFYGVCTRAHVNDLKDKSGNFAKVDLSNTYATPEETFNTLNVLYDTKPISDLDDDVFFVYYYINNPTQEGLTWYKSYSDWQSKTSSEYRACVSNFEYQYNSQSEIIKVPVSGATCVAMLEKDSNILCINLWDTGDASPSASIAPFALGDFTSSAITSIAISKIKPTSRTTIVTEGLSFVDRWCGTAVLNSTLGGMPTDNAVISLYNRNGSGDYTLTDDYTYSELYSMFVTNSNLSGKYSHPFYANSNESISIPTDYSDYISNGITKAATQIYNPIFINGNYFNFFDCNYLVIQLTPDCTNYIIKAFGNKNFGSSFSYSVANQNIFAPDTVLDYWTRLNAERSSIAVSKTQFNTAMNVVGGAVSLVGNAAKAVAGDTKSIGGFVGSISNLAGAAGNLAYQTQLTNLDKEIAAAQYQNGIQSSDTTAGSYSILDAKTLPYFERLVQNDENYKQICLKLHKFGYSTFLRLEDVYHKHRREAFNYFQCSEVEIFGTTEQIQRELTEMFIGGVWLWSKDIQNFEQRNLQEDML